MLVSIYFYPRYPTHLFEFYHLKKIAWISLFLVVFAAVAGVVGYVVYSRLYRPQGISLSRKLFPVMGIDVSGHTRRVDFRKAKKQGFSFVFLKATEGATYLDKTFQSRYTQSKQAGLPVGAYHFFKFNKPGKLQAINFLGQVKGKSFELPLVLDIEEWQNPTLKSRKEIIKEIGEFLAVVENKTGQRMLLYTNENGCRKFIKGHFSNDIWICSFKHKPSIHKPWTFWQYSHKGQFSFAKGFVDINAFHGTNTQWQAYLRKKSWIIDE